MTPSSKRSPRDAAAESHPVTAGYRTRLRIIHATIAALSAVGGAVIGFACTLAIVVAKAQAGSYIFAMEDLVAFRWELTPILFGLGAGFMLGRRRPHAVAWAAVCGFGAMIAGILLGATLGPVAWGNDAGRWAGGVVGGALGLVTGSAVSLRIRRIPRHPLIAGVASVLAFLGAAGFALFGATNLIDIDPLDFPESAGVPVPAASDVDAVVFLLGDAGAAVGGQSPLLDALQADVERWSTALHRDSAVSVAYLGDLVYPDGVHDRDHPDFPVDSGRLWSQVELVGGPAAKANATVGLFLTGNHDWGNSSGDAGLDRIANLGQELADARRAGHFVSLLPAAGDPGPTVRDLRRNVRLVFFDTHWFLQERHAGQRREFFERLGKALDGARDREVILLSHHPFLSAGPHGAIVPGYHTGGLAYILKQAGALVQDLNSPAYVDLLAGLRRTFEGSRRPPLIYAGGHDHSLQVLTGAHGFDPRFVLVSGAGSKVSSIQMGPGLVWGGSQPGYMMLLFRKDDGVDLFVVGGDQQYLECTGADSAAARCLTDGANAFEIVYSASLLGPSRQPRDIADPIPDTLAPGTPWWTEEDRVTSVRDRDRPDEPLQAAPVAVPTRILLQGIDSVTTTPGRTYPAGWLHRGLAGDLNRHLWRVPVRLPVVDLAEVAGGLRPSELIGGKQTVGLRLLGRDGLEYDFRPIVKHAGRVLPPWLREGPVEDVLQDQMAAQFPLGALVVSELLDAAGIKAPRPVAAVMPNDPRLGPFRPMFAGRVGMLAVNANEREGGRPGFAGFRQIVGTTTAFDSVSANPASSFDGEAFLRIRLIDFLVGDWDRHPGQWRWGRRADSGAVRWSPIPEDRDWAFSHIDGFTAAMARVFLPTYVGFTGTLPSLRRLAKSGEPVDRRVLNQLDRPAFAAAARAIQSALSDSAIEAAVAALPAPYVALERERLVNGLRARRAQLAEYAEAYYRRLARTVHVYGVAGSRDVVEFTPRTDQRVRLRVLTGGPDGPARFERLLDGRDTREVRLYIDAADDEVIGGDDLPFKVSVIEGQPPSS